MALTPASSGGQPLVVGLDFHLGMGTQCLEKLEVSADGKVDIQMSLPGKRKGKVWVAKEDGKEVEEIEVELK